MRGDIPHLGRLMDRLEAMQVVLTAVECGSLSKASRKLSQPLATVSRKVSASKAISRRIY